MLSGLPVFDTDDVDGLSLYGVATVVRLVLPTYSCCSSFPIGD